MDFLVVDLAKTPKELVERPKEEYDGWDKESHYLAHFIGLDFHTQPRWRSESCRKT